MVLSTRIAKRIKELDRRFPRVVSWRPQPGPQELAYHHPAKILGYGGEPGGGKTDLALGLALTAHRSSLILRRRQVDLGGLRYRLSQILGVDSVPLTVRVRSGGLDRVLHLGGCHTEDSKQKYQGQAHDLHVFDEVSQFTPSQVQYIIRWNRSAIAGQRCRVIYTFNPPETISGLWVNSFFSPWLNPQHENPAQPGEVRYFLDGREVEGEDVDRAVSVTFVRAFTADNKYYGSDYHAYLLSIAGVKEFATAVEQDYFQLIPIAHLEAAQTRWRSRVSCAHGAKVRISADIARGGSDKMTIAELYEDDFIRLYAYEGRAIADGPAAARIIAKHYEGCVPGAVIFLDVIGWGAAAYDFLIEWGYPALAVNVAEHSYSTDRSGRVTFINRRAEIGWALRDALDPSYGSRLAIPDRVMLETGQEIQTTHIYQEIIAQRWLPVGRGVQLKSKRQIKEELGRSPDYYDALTLLFAGDSVYHSCF